MCLCVSVLMPACHRPTNDTLMSATLLLRRNWELWVPAQCLNFLLIPVPMQVLFANMVGLVWNTYLSIVAHGNHSEDADKE